MLGANASKNNARAACFFAWALAILIPTSLIAAVALPWLDRMGSLEREITAGDDQIVRYRRLIATLPRLQAELDQVLSNEDVKAFYYDAPTLQLAGAEMQQELQGLVSESGARLVSTQMLPTNPQEQPPTVRIRTQIQGSTDALFSVLYRIEEARPFLFVDQLSVRASARRAARRNSRLRARRATSARPQGELTIRLDILGYALGNS